MGGGRDAEVAYSLGTAYAALGDQEQARQSWQKAAAAASEAPQFRRRGPGGLSPQTVQGYYRGLALGKLGQDDKAEALFRGLVDSANQALQQSPAKTDSGASLEVLRAGRDRLATAHYVAGLGYLGLNDKEKARQEMAQALQASPDHPGARAAIAALGN
jgi:tetratricopeptide (TPR) repeat protein